ncbi:hypothetical protein [Mesorhizobium sp. GR13]|uniref:hypothetical protein n=1 Tax=Mesorhizobium sp. GR13 TaxID=2562308 RepID=UPI0010BF7ABB|nr:hypothetical protein [Mesorhizobium sp. GR13]
MPFHKQPDLGSDIVAIASIAIRHCRLPHPEVVERCGGAIFPTIRDQRRRGTLNADLKLMFDDNVTPRWAMFWAHGMPQTHHPRGWTIAHVWKATKDSAAYTHLANLCLMPECLGSLSDKDGPLSRFLEYHAWSVYGWRPEHTNSPDKPAGYDDVTWVYLGSYPEPLEFVRDRITTLNNQRVAILRQLMGFADE